MEHKLSDALKGMWDNLTDKQRAEARRCKSAEELSLLAGREGLELTDEALDAIAGGCDSTNDEDAMRERKETDESSSIHLPSL